MRRKIEYFLNSKACETMTPRGSCGTGRWKRSVEGRGAPDGQLPLTRAVQKLLADTHSVLRNIIHRHTCRFRTPILVLPFDALRCPKKITSQYSYDYRFPAGISSTRLKLVGMPRKIRPYGISCPEHQRAER